MHYQHAQAWSGRCKHSLSCFIYYNLMNSLSWEPEVLSLAAAEIKLKRNNCEHCIINTCIAWSGRCKHSLSCFIYYNLMNSLLWEPEVLSRQAFVFVRSQGGAKTRPTGSRQAAAKPPECFSRSESIKDMRGV